MNKTLKTLLSLRTIHGNISARDISNEDLETVLRASTRAANASARQSYSIIVIDEREMMKTLCGYAGSRGLLFCVDFTRLKRQAGRLGHAFETGGVTSLITGAIDTALAAQTAAVAAKSLGIDSLFTNGIHRGDMERVFRLMELPAEHCFPLIMLILGYPAEEPKEQKGRLAGTGIMHFGKYHPLTDETLDRVIVEYDDPTRRLGMSDAWRKKGLAHYLDWFYTDWVGTFPKIEAKSQMLEILERIGFSSP
jgi:nitroreductase